MIVAGRASAPAIFLLCEKLLDSENMLIYIRRD